MLAISSLTFITCPADIAAELGGLLLQDCANMIGVAIKANAGADYVPARWFQPQEGQAAAAAIEVATCLPIMPGRYPPAAIAFVQACYEHRNVQPLDLHAAAGTMLERMEDALTTHVYSLENGDRIPANCDYVASIEQVRAALGLIPSGIETTPVWRYSAAFIDTNGEEDDFQSEEVADTAGEALDRGHAALLQMHRGARSIRGDEVVLIAGKEA